MKRKIKITFCVILLSVFTASDRANAMCGFGWISATPPTPTCSCASNRIAIKRMNSNVCQEEKCVTAGAVSHYIDQGWVYGCCAVARLDENETNTIIIYPNPVTNTLYVWGMFEANSKLEIHDITGRIVYTNAAASQVEVDVSSWMSGMYFVTVKTEQGYTVKKLRVE